MPATPRPGMEITDALDSDLGWTLGVVFRAYVRTANALVSHLPGGPRGYQVLTAAVQELPGGQGALAQRLGVDKTVMTYLLDDLEQAGLVERRPDPADRRNKRIVATERGRATWTETQTRLEHAEEHVLAPLDPADRSVFRELLRKLAVRANALDPVHDTCRLVTELAPETAPVKPRRSPRR
ncbi:MarR family winged helix-turn-helix transcriptional regulator [Streptosporangium amethystogenes]|uniref:MarR family winged helix-turn-helix transcriptional regulator n=1 Tax=Streptosporangium amethystogenes TaxID=2002 RepID=UPI0037BDA45E